MLLLLLAWAAALAYAAPSADLSLDVIKKFHAQKRRWTNPDLIHQARRRLQEDDIGKQVADWLVSLIKSEDSKESGSKDSDDESDENESESWSKDSEEKDFSLDDLLKEFGIGDSEEVETPWEKDAEKETSPLACMALMFEMLFKMPETCGDILKRMEEDNEQHRCSITEGEKMEQATMLCADDGQGKQCHHHLLYFLHSFEQAGCMKEEDCVEEANTIPVCGTCMPACKSDSDCCEDEVCHDAIGKAQSGFCITRDEMNFVDEKWSESDDESKDDDDRDGRRRLQRWGDKDSKDSWEKKDSKDSWENKESWERDWSKDSEDDDSEADEERWKRWKDKDNWDKEWEKDSWDEEKENDWDWKKEDWMDSSDEDDDMICKILGHRKHQGMMGYKTGLVCSQNKDDQFCMNLVPLLADDRGNPNCRAISSAGCCVPTLIHANEKCQWELMEGDDESSEVTSDSLEEECEFDMNEALCPGVNLDVCEKMLVPDSDSSDDFGEWSEELCVNNQGYNKCKKMCGDCGVCHLKGLDSCECGEYCDGCAKFLPCLEKDMKDGDDKGKDDSSSHDDDDNKESGRCKDMKSLDECNGNKFCKGKAQGKKLKACRPKNKCKKLKKEDDCEEDPNCTPIYKKPGTKKQKFKKCSNAK